MAYTTLNKMATVLSVIFAVLLIISFFDVESIRLLSVKCLRQH